MLLKVVAFGWMHLLTKIIGYLPGPLIAGQLIDATCIFWQYSDCGERQSCQLYTLDDYRLNYSLLMAIPGIFDATCRRVKLKSENMKRNPWTNAHKFFPKN